MAKPKRRQFSAEYRLRILEEAERCTRPGEVGRLLRREGLYSSHLTTWRKARRKGSLRELASKKRGAKPAERNPLDAKVRSLEANVARLEHELHTAHTILDVRGKVAGLVCFNSPAHGAPERRGRRWSAVVGPLTGWPSGPTSNVVATVFPNVLNGYMSVKARMTSTGDGKA